MRIGPGIVLPQAPPLTPAAASTLAALAAPDRATLFRAVALAAAAPPPWIATPMPATSPSTAAPLLTASALAPPSADRADDPGAALVSLIRTLPTSLGSSAQAAIPLPTNAAPEPPAPQSSLLPMSRSESAQPAPADDRLSLSAAASSLKVETSPLPRTPAGRFLLDLLESLTGEPGSSLQFLEPGARDPVSAGYAALTAKNVEALLSLLVRGAVRTADDQRIDLSFRLNVQHPPGAGVPDLATRVAIREALEQLALLKHALDYPGPAARLAGQSLSFEAALDPRTAWALPGFYLSGHLLFGLPRDAEDWETGEDQDDTQEQPETPTGDHDADAQPRDPVRRKRKTKAAAENELTPLPADGGLPIISARRWLELELRHVRRQLRLWMLLPPMAPV